MARGRKPALTLDEQLEKITDENDNFKEKYIITREDKN